MSIIGKTVTFRKQFRVRDSIRWKTYTLKGQVIEKIYKEYYLIKLSKASHEKIMDDLDSEFEIPSRKTYSISGERIIDVEMDHPLKEIN